MNGRPITGTDPAITRFMMTRGGGGLPRVHDTRSELSWSLQSPKKKGLTKHNIFVTFKPMDYTITYYSESVQEQILNLPDTLAARYVVLTRRMVART